MNDLVKTVITLIVITVVVKTLIPPRKPAGTSESLRDTFNKIDEQKRNSSDPGIRAEQARLDHERAVAEELSRQMLDANSDLNRK